MIKAWKKIPKEPDREKEKELQSEPLEKNDRLAMITAAFLTLFLPAIIVLIILCGLAYILFIVL